MTKPMTMGEVVGARAALETSISEARAEFERKLTAMQTELTYLKSLEAAGDVYIEDVQIVERYLRVEGEISVYHDSARVKILREAAADVAAGCPYLKTKYMATKNYDHWRDQRTDTEYGYAPSHGYIVFRVGLRQDQGAPGIPTGADAEACVRVLTAWAEGKTPKRGAA